MTEAVVVGGGVVGLSAARALARAGLSVTLRTAAGIGDGASAAAHGQLVPPAAPLTGLWKASLTAYDEVSPGTTTGRLVLAETATEAAALLDGPGTVLAGPELAALEPALAPGVRAALHQPEARRIDPREVTRALHAELVALGVRVSEYDPVVDILREPGRWRLRGTDGTGRLHRVVVLTTGLGTRQLCAQLGHRMRLTGSRGRLLRTVPTAPLLGHILGEVSIGPARTGTAVGLLVHQRADGVVLVGASWTAEDQAEPADLDRRILRRAATLVPALADIPVAGRRSGVRPLSPTGRPIIDEIDDDLYVCCGHGGEGFILGPGSAALLADLVLDRRPVTDPAPFRHQEEPE
ncbi:NAD(P)/FAD-dependent oxidoreductase [Actinoalloteichus caeruleus]|uniref:Glycine oxidase n=1 Tax=Actinoalloteichus caeruleus DSM 43889 TaxID=1120930 RepID=A0ABT1JEK6_ACTCY|nr:FAD-dependent oxidoreductase [Actinoalloteichus caeruleus]MCP2330644.1 glycine oxidase [Actinoalloteichus caeruleus DSM 43889]